jgi:hypothetical protein
MLYQYLQPVLKEKFDLSCNTYFEEVLFSKKNEVKKIIEFKGSETFVLILDNFCE